ncbi:CAMK family protein kinase [Trichomonas vaginalis G3]|uniref:CAMK family protein kinase n=1 Tax=Trichomonas vaginalis (strain ATCC PRA-98 / G3) TaxID=412133 RepID=A2DH03_TRIV3|nr:protein serine/threonine kinase protein [Trichomonas vaginalis G3]EAY20313.1 CAMK family protein kinase [Trichomonas vaginalis G3]KAI5530698.1 protein serine/threonine kinase protein [Trichomonas vaginalis G3]|eukprot:XP_001581299.1 CAMK family protein kinase [Trichomonas vaginalis G3]
MLFNGENDPLIKQFESDGSCSEETKPLKQINQYLFLKKIGNGAFSNVYLAIDQNTKEKYAIKKFKLSELQHIENGVSQLEREISLMRRYSHNNILKLFEVLHNTEKDIVYLVIEYANCGSLFDLINQPIPLQDNYVCSIFHQILEALQYLHNNGMVHQDIKPSNILIKSDGRAILADFGVGHSFQSTEMVVGSPAYQAPEALTDGDCGIQSSSPAKEDVWSLGVTLFQTEYQQIPYDGETVFEIIRNIKSTTLQYPEGANPEIEQVMRMMLAVDPVKRATVDELLKSPFFMKFNGIVPCEQWEKDVDTSINNAQIVKYNAKVCEGMTSFVRVGLTSVDLIRSIENTNVNKKKLPETENLESVPMEKYNCFSCCILY